MTEEQVTKALLEWFIKKDWEIVCYDFPQSGTGRFLHPNDSTGKNQASINPDIVAVKGQTCVFIENKDRFYLPDYKKQNRLMEQDNYAIAIGNLLRGYLVRKIYYGIGLPVAAHIGKAIEAESLVDFVLGVAESREIKKLYLKNNFDIFG